jgi:hypothetical protein
MTAGGEAGQGSMQDEKSFCHQRTWPHVALLSAPYFSIFFFFFVVMVFELRASHHFSHTTSPFLL